MKQAKLIILFKVRLVVTFLGRGHDWNRVWCSKDKEQDKLKGPTLPEQRVTGLLSLCHIATIAMSQSPPKQHAPFFSSSAY